MDFFAGLVIGMLLFPAIYGGLKLYQLLSDHEEVGD